jgi:LDH2 family malate/lactate/ureidoglycolate dehydrogenase
MNTAKKMSIKQIYLPKQQIEKLEKTKAKQGISMAEIIRRALDQYFATNK